MEKVTLIMSSVLPVPATKGGAVENLLENIAKEQEKENRIQLTIISAFEKNAFYKSKAYTKTDFEFIKVSSISKILDKLIFVIAKYILRKKDLMAYSFILQRIDYYRKISKKIQKYDYGKLVLENSLMLYLCLKWKKNYLKYKDRYYYHCHNSCNNSIKLSLKYIDIIEETKKFICVSEYMLKDLCQNLQKYTDKNITEKSVVLRNCIDDNLFNKNVTDKGKKKLKEKYNIKNDEKIILFTGRLTKEKGIVELLKAVEKCKFEKLKLLIIGGYFFDTNIKSDFEDEVQKYKNKLKEKVMFTGFVNYDNIYKFYKLADIAVLPSIWDDPAPLTIIEALTSGLPIITTNSGGIPEYATNGSAIILERDEKLVKNLAKEIDNLLNNEEKLKEMEQKCILVSKELNLKNYYNNFLKVLEE